MRTLISNGLVVTADGSYPADVLVDGETIALVGSHLAAAGVTADATIDATGRYVVPGGIDGHTHFELPFGGTFAKDTFETGTKAAAHGGTTSIIDFAVQPKGRPLHEGLDVWMAKAQGKAVLDYGFHMIMSDVNDASLAEMDQLVDEGVPGLQALHRLPGRLPEPGRPHLPGDEADPEERRPDPHARRERAGHRRDRRRPRGGRHDRPDRPRPGPLPGARGRGDEPAASASPRPPAPRSTSSTSRRATRSRRWRRPGTAARRSSPRRARSTSSSPSTTSGTGSRAPSTSAARRSDRRTTTRTSGAGLLRDDLQLVGHRSLPLRLRGPEGARPGRLPQDPERPAGRRGPRRPAPPRRRRRGTALARALGGDHGDEPRPRCSGCTRRRGPSPSAPTPTSWSTTPTGSGRSARRRTTWTSTTRSSRAARSRARSDVVMSRGTVLVRDGEWVRAGRPRAFIRRSRADYVRLA